MTLASLQWMQGITARFDTPVVHALGGALLHFAWEATLVAGIAALAAFSLRRAEAWLRHVVYLTGLLSLPLIFAATFFMLFARPAEGFPLLAGLAAAAAAMAARVEALLPLLVAGWVLGVTALALYSLGGWMAMARLRRAVSFAVPGEWMEAFDRMRERIHCSARVRLGFSGQVDSPCALGWMRPLILMPAAALTGVPLEHLEALFAHELSHIRRGDYLLNLVQRGVEVVFFFHPAVWWLSHRVSVEREHCCDDAAIAACGNRIGYARALVDLEVVRAGRLSPDWAPAVGADGPELRGRIHRILRIAPPARSQEALARATLAVAGSAAFAVVSVLTIAGSAAGSAPLAPAMRARRPRPAVALVRTVPAVGARLIKASYVRTEPALIRPAVARRPVRTETAEPAVHNVAKGLQAVAMDRPVEKAEPTMARPAVAAADSVESDYVLVVMHSAATPTPTLLLFRVPDNGGEPGFQIHVIEFVKFVLRPGQSPAEVIMLST